MIPKWVSNRVNLEFKLLFNKVIDAVNKLPIDAEKRDNATNKRIDNLVLQSGGTSPNEVIDARVNSLGQTFDTLHARLLAGEKLTASEIEAVNQNYLNQKDEIEQLNKIIQSLYGGDGGVIDIFVSSKIGNDITADGTQSKPFKTIQAAINSLPLLSTSLYYIYVEPGSYLEDVTISNITSGKLEIIAANTVTSNAIAGDTGVYVRSIKFEECRMYCAVRGVTQVDVNNADNFFIKFIGVSYGAVENCRASLNTKNINGYRAFMWDRSISGNIYTSLASNQFYAIFAAFGTGVRISGDVAGTGNNIVVRADGSTVYKAASATITGTTAESKTNGGQVFS